MTNNNWDVPYYAGLDQQRKEWVYNQIIAPKPELKDDPVVLYGDLELLYYRMLNDGDIPDYRNDLANRLSTIEGYNLNPRVSDLEETVIGLESDKADYTEINSTITVEYIRKTAEVKAHTIVRLRGWNSRPYAVRNIRAFDQMVSEGVAGEAISSFYSRTGTTVLINATGWWSALNNKLMGLAIFDGVLLKGWDVGESDLGKEAAVFMKDGSFRIYSNSTSPEQIIAEGGWNSFSWGSAAFIDGNKTNFENIWRYSLSSGQLTGRQLIGTTQDGDLLIITFPGKTDVSGATAQEVLTAVSGLNIKDLYFLDGGGSAQTMVNGEYVIASADGIERVVGNVLGISAPVSSSAKLITEWKDIPLNAGFSPQVEAKFRIVDNKLYFKGAIKPTSGNFSATATLSLTAIVPELDKIEPTDAIVAAFGTTGSPPMRMWIQGGRIQLRVVGASDVQAYVGLAALNGVEVYQILN